MPTIAGGGSGNLRRDFRSSIADRNDLIAKHVPSVFATLCMFVLMASRGEVALAGESETITMRREE